MNTVFGFSCFLAKLNNLRKREHRITVCKHRITVYKHRITVCKHRMTERWPTWPKHNVCSNTARQNIETLQLLYYKSKINRHLFPRKISDGIDRRSWIKFIPITIMCSRKIPGSRPSEFETGNEVRHENINAICQETGKEVTSFHYMSKEVTKFQ